MPALSVYPSTQIAPFQDKLKTVLGSPASYEQAAQKFAETLYTEFSPSVVLARIYVTLPYGPLPPFNKTFVERLAQAKGVSSLLKETTPVLSLVGTAGKKPAWMDRRKSEGHVGIPLCSASFVDAIPMLSRLLQELGVDLAWFDKQNLALVEKSAMGLSGMFYVAKASADTDAQKRKIIPAQEFVAANGLQTVFGMGTTYIGGAFAVCIIFTTEALAKEQLKPFLTLINIFKVATSRLVAANTWWAG